MNPEVYPYRVVEIYEEAQKEVIIYFETSDAAEAYRDRSHYPEGRNMSWVESWNDLSFRWQM